MLGVWRTTMSENAQALTAPEANAHAAVAAAPVSPRLTNEERLRIECVYLKMQVAQLTVQSLDNMKEQKVTEMRALQEEMTHLTAELSTKYGVPIGRTTVQADGTIVYPQANPPRMGPGP